MPNDRPNDFTPVLIMLDSETKYPFITGIACFETYTQMRKGEIDFEDFPVTYAIHTDKSGLLVAKNAILDIWDTIENTPNKLCNTDATSRTVKSYETKLNTPMLQETLIPLEIIATFGMYE